MTQPAPTALQAALSRARAAQAGAGSDAEGPAAGAARIAGATGAIMGTQASGGLPAAPAPAVSRSARRAALAQKKAAAQAALRPRPAPASTAAHTLDAAATLAQPPAPPGRRGAPPPARRTAERITHLQDLAAVARRLRDEHERAQAEEKARREAAARLEAERHLFSRSVGPVTPLRNPNLARLRRHQPAPLPVQHWLDEERVLLESISDDFDVSTLLDTDDQLSYRRPGIGVEVTRRLRSGHWSIQRQLDLHGLRVDEAREALGEFVRQAHKVGLRCVRVVHGKGLGSPGKSPVLKGRVQRWLVQKNEVLAFVQARPMDGGAGALVVLLKPSARRNP